MQRKGIYKISNPFLRFYFEFIYPNMSFMMQKSPEAFYDEFLSDKLDIFAADAFSDICGEYMRYLAQEGKLGFEVDESGVFDGKEGYIDYLGMDENRLYGAAAFCCYEMNYMPYEYYERALRTIASTKMRVNDIYLFSRNGFDEKINLEAKMHDNIRLLTLSDWLDKDL